MTRRLSLVPASTPDAAQAVREAVKKMPRPPGLIQCPKCGSRSVMTVTNGALIDRKDRYSPGTVIHDRVCYDCHRRGVDSPMMPSRPKPVT